MGIQVLRSNVTPCGKGPADQKSLLVDVPQGMSLRDDTLPGLGCKQKGTPGGIGLETSAEFEMLFQAVFVYIIVRFQNKSPSKRKNGKISGARALNRYTERSTREAIAA
jgi:hypothetical protein